MSEVLTKPIELFYAGTHTDFRRKVVTIDQPTLNRSVAWFNKTKQRLPLVVGHPDSEDDNFGVATKLGINGDGRVVITEVDGLDRTFRKIVNSGELPGVSAKIRLKGHPSNASGGIEFQHAGFFGKSRVALNKLKEASFSQFNELEFYFMADAKKKFDPEETLDEDETVGEDDTIDEEDDKPAKKKTGKTVAMSAFELDKAEFEAEKAQFRRAQRIEPTIEKWVREGRIAPSVKSQMVAAFAAMPEDLEFSFSADGEEAVQSASEFFMEFVGSIKPTIVYGEVAGVKNVPTPPSNTVAFAQYEGDSLVPSTSPSMELFSKVLATGVDVTDTAAFTKALKQLAGG